MPDGESLDYTMKEYMRFVEYVQNCVERLKSQGELRLKLIASFIIFIFPTFL
jgi:hypothetical protein